MSSSTKSDHFDSRNLQQDLGRRAVRGSAALFAGRAINALLTLLSTVVLARLLLPEDFGLIAMVMPFIGFVTFFRDSGLHMATIQQAEINHQQISTLFWVNLLLGFLLMVGVTLAAPVIADFYGREEVRWVTIACAVNILIGASSIQHAALLKRNLAYFRMTLIGIAAQLIGIAFGILGAWYGLSYWALVLMILATSVATTILTWLASGWMPGRPYRGSGVRRMLIFGGGLTISNLLNQVTLYVDNILIGRLLGDAQLGYFDRAKQLFLVPLNQVMLPLGNLTISVLCRVADSPERYSRMYLRMQEKLLILSSLLAGLLVVYGDLVVTFLLGPKWISAGPILQAIAIGGLVIPISGSVSWLLITQGRAGDLAAWSPVSLGLRIVAIIVGIRWGLFGIAVSISVAQVIGFLLFTLWVGRKGAVSARDVWKNMIPAAVAATASCFVGWWVKVGLDTALPASELFVGAFVMCLVFLIVLWLIPAGKAALLDFKQLGSLALNNS